MDGSTCYFSSKASLCVPRRSCWIHSECVIKWRILTSFESISGETTHLSLVRKPWDKCPLLSVLGILSPGMWNLVSLGITYIASFTFIPCPLLQAVSEKEVPWAWSLSHSSSSPVLNDAHLTNGSLVAVWIFFCAASLIGPVLSLKLIVIVRVGLSF